MSRIDRVAFVKDDFNRITFNAYLYHPGDARPGPPGGVVRDLVFDLQRGELSLSPVSLPLFAAASASVSLHPINSNFDHFIVESSYYRLAVFSR